MFTREIEVIDFSKIGESIIFLIISYGFGHLLHAVGNGFENVVWWVAGGKPSKWLLKKNSFGKSLFDADLTNKIKQKLHGEFGALTTDYDRLVLTKIRVANKEGVLETFNGNYSLLRGLSIAILIISILLFFTLGWREGLCSLILFILASVRMIRFAIYYGRELYRIYLTL